MKRIKLFAWSTDAAAKNVLKKKSVPWLPTWTEQPRGRVMGQVWKSTLLAMLEWWIDFIRMALYSTQFILRWSLKGTLTLQD